MRIRWLQSINFKRKNSNSRKLRQDGRFVHLYFSFQHLGGTMKIFSNKQLKWCGTLAVAMFTALTPLGTSYLYGDTITRQNGTNGQGWVDSSPSSNQYWLNSSGSNVASPAPGDNVNFGGSGGTVNLGNLEQQGGG
ncbi:MAG: hypothetical protein LBE12_02570, partial [Planctomycetaceae bacterium]|nr:hypothetical protein [Planctomycetaceae bacterium]